MSVAATMNPDQMNPDQWLKQAVDLGTIPVSATQAANTVLTQYQDHPDSVHVAEMQKNVGAGKYAATESKKFLWKGSTDRMAIIRYDKKGGYLGCDRTTKEVARRVWKTLLNHDWSWCGKGITLTDDALRYQPVNVRNAVDLLESGT